jgi:CheY-like chemotaxis protein
MTFNNNGARAIEILMVEDNPGDVRLTQEAMNEARMTTHLSVVVDGVEAMEFLRGEGRFAGSPRPDLILLDLNLPRRDGHEVLVELKSDPDLRSIPVVMLTSSRAEKDVERAYELHANCYIAKPADFQQYMEVVRQIDDFWVSAVTLPRR